MGEWDEWDECYHECRMVSPMKWQVGRVVVWVNRVLCRRWRLAAHRLWASRGQPALPEVLLLRLGEWLRPHAVQVSIGLVIARARSARSNLQVACWRLLRRLRRLAMTKAE